ncbi:SDR family NAD(P)-dependent oxidoreductase [Alkalimarinus sediminis]|uniref:SDR family NAD(P)-dependent oxidoreductase n=1 Tax=Alkalimarinus sediminis TaxID=1632866 RepID=A0A9E8HLQ9_9ALTE|nr:SDR family NAD(P)-dependent oxidoreductase [Alkalimarinus sediminis]UZW75196.1 SDR family NAD(P)-dependent oxidoreductase [Alkalimarinus sediminis]
MKKKNNRTKGKTIVITGASSGIGRAAAIQLGEAGAKVLLVARREDALNEVVDMIKASGGQAQSYPTDLSDLDAVDQLGDKLLAEHARIDVLVNNAGRSIRRPVVESLQRYHDFERCMVLNYYSPVRLTRKLLPSMLDAHDGQIVNSSTWGTMLPVAGFGPYNASKAALDSIAECMRVELADKGIAITQVHFPLVHTPMSNATEKFKKLPGLSAEEAGEWIVRAVEERPPIIIDAKTRVARGFYYHFPRVSEAISRRLPFSVK